MKIRDHVRINAPDYPHYHKKQGTIKRIEPYGICVKITGIGYIWFNHNEQQAIMVQTIEYETI